MTSPEIMKASVLDILFENRNKMYGAYPLRKFYHQRLGMALTFSFLFVFLLLLLLKPDYKLAYTPPTNENEEMIVRVIEVAPPVEIPPPPPLKAAPPASHAATIKFNQILISAQPVNEDIVPAQDELAGAVIANSTKPGEEGNNLPPAPVSGKGHSAEGVVEQQTSEAFVAVEAAPEFPGGAAAWLHFLNRHLRSPGALGAGEKKTVMVRFLVSKDGSITDFEIVQSGGSMFDNEVIRVLKKMPKWKPAIQNGHSVAVPFTQPVTFVGVEE